MLFQVIVAGAPKAFACRGDQTVLAAISGTGAACVPVGCRSGGCGVCRVQVLEGEFETGLMSQAEVCDADRARGLALACQLFPRSDLRVLAVGPVRSCSNDATAELLRGLASRSVRSTA